MRSSELAAERAGSQGVGDRHHGGAEMERARRGRGETQPGRFQASPASSRMRWMQDALLAWYAEYRRDLPWRRTRDPYASPSAR